MILILIQKCLLRGFEKESVYVRAVYAGACFSQRLHNVYVTCFRSSAERGAARAGVRTFKLGAVLQQHVYHLWDLKKWTID